MTPRALGLMRETCVHTRGGVAETMLAVADLYGPAPADPMRELQEFVAAGYLDRRKVILRRPLEFANLGWEFGDPVPDFDSWEWQAQKLWAVEPQVTSLYRAGRMAWRIYGNATAGKVNFASLSHDTRIMDVRLWLAEHHPELLDDWLMEDLREVVHGVKRPDILMIRDGNPYLAIEVCGMYTKARFKALHEHCENVLKVPYWIL